jgi:hypothetical protein
MIAYYRTQSLFALRLMLYNSDDAHAELLQHGQVYCRTIRKYINDAGYVIFVEGHYGLVTEA